MASCAAAWQTAEAEAQPVGFDPRRWGSSRSGAARVTANADARAAEREAWQQQQAFRRHRQQHGPPPAASRPRVVVTVGSAPGITPELVRHWGEALAGHRRWRDLPLEALQHLAARTRARGLDPTLPLEESLERRSPGLGRELSWALRGPRSRARLAVRAVFALHGIRAPELLDRQPLRLVEELLEACNVGPRQSERQQGGQRPGPGPGTGSTDRCRQQALDLLGLENGASREAVKAAHRRLVKRHHPDLGGDAESFRAIDAAYRLLIA